MLLEFKQLSCYAAPLVVLALHEARDLIQNTASNKLQGCIQPSTQEVEAEGSGFKVISYGVRSRLVWGA